MGRPMNLAVHRLDGVRVDIKIFSTFERSIETVAVGNFIVAIISIHVFCHQNQSIVEEKKQG